MTTHSFESEDAEKYGVFPAVILSNIRFWCAKNAANGKNIYDGEVWTYNSIQAWTILFPYATKDQIRNALDKLEKAGVIITGNYSSSAYDRTKWYCVKGQLHLGNLPNQCTDNKPDKTFSSGKIPDKEKKKFGNEDDHIAAKWIFKLIQKILPNAKEPSWDDWANEIRLMRERDKRTHKEICELFKFANEDSFWGTNILSPHKLRKQWDQLEAKRITKDNDVNQGPSKSYLLGAI